MMTSVSIRAARIRSLLRVPLCGALIAAAAAIVLAGCGQNQNAPPKQAPASAPAAKPPVASAPAASAPPASDNAFEYYEAALQKDPNNQVARDALRETFPFGATQVERTISQNNFDEADREIGLLAKAYPTNYTLTILRSKLDAQRKLQQRQQQQQAQKEAELAAKQAAAAKAAAEQAAAARAEAERAAAAKAAPPPPPVVRTPKPAPPPPSAGETRVAEVIQAAAPSYPIEAARNQTSGYAVVEFTVEPDGSVSDAHIVDSSPRRVFDNAAIQAVKRSR